MRFALKAVALAAVLLSGSQALALGLGRLTVLSALGEPLRAEIEVSSITPEEASTLSLRVASPDAYRAAGVEYNAVLPSTSVQVVRRPEGTQVLRVSSDRAVLEPFVDVIVEANWASGRLVREYTMLFDPPGARSAPAAPVATTAPVFSAAPAPVVAAPQYESRPMPAPVVVYPAPAPVYVESSSESGAPIRGRQRGAVVNAQPRGAEADSYRVRPGDTLRRVAARTQRGGVSLDQMLVGLFRSNPQAFASDNMNRLRSGSVLTVPQADELQAVSPESAREIIATQSADFGAYRQRLASGVTTSADTAPTRQARGQVQTTVDDRKQAAATTPDRLTLSRPNAKAAAAEAKAAAADAKLAKDAENKANALREAEILRNNKELNDVKTAAAQLKAASPAVASASPGGAATNVTPGTTPGIKVPDAVAPVTLPKSVADAPGAAASAVVAAAPKPAPAPKPAVVPAAPVQVAEEGPGFFEGLTDHAFFWPATGVLAALLAGLGLYRLRGRLRKPAGETSFLESRLQPDSFFGASGGQRVDTHEAAAGPATGSSMSYSLSQLDAIGDVDPVAEADVYLAYGRDLQAEEILKEAMRATPDRLAIRTKLLEVYAKRRDTKGFELLATQVYSITKGQGEDWAKAQAQGLSIDPDNALYHAGGAPFEVRGNSGQVVEPLGASTVPYTAPVSNAFQPAADATLDSRSLDLDLEAPGPAPAPAKVAAAAPQRPGINAPVDFNLGDDLGALGKPAAPGKPVKPGLIASAMAMGAGAVTSAAAAVRKPAAPAPAPDLSSGLDFDLGALDGPGQATSQAPVDTTVDFGDFDLNAPAKGGGLGSDPLSRKLELAEEFRQIGDLEGARDLLEEVLSKATGALKSKAQGMLAQLG